MCVHGLLYITATLGWLLHMQVHIYKYLPESFGLTKIVSFVNAYNNTGTLSNCCAERIHSVLVLTIAYMFVMLTSVCDLIPMALICLKILLSVSKYCIMTGV